MILRPSNAYGRGHRLNRQQGLIAMALDKLMRNEKLIIWGNGENIRDYIFIEDLSQIALELLDIANNSVINIGTGKGYTTNEVISIINKISNKKLMVEYTDMRYGDVTNMILDNTYLRSMVQHDFTCLEDGIKMFYGSI